MVCDESIGFCVNEDVWILEGHDRRRGVVTKVLGKDRFAVKAASGSQKSRVVCSERLCKIDKFRQPSSCCIIGSWDDWESHQMSWNDKLSCFEYDLRLSWDGAVSFKFILEGDYDACVYPDTKDASPYVEHGILGPGSSDSVNEWTLGLHSEDEGASGRVYNIQLFIDPVSGPKRVYCEHRNGHESKRRWGRQKYSDPDKGKEANTESAELQQAAEPGRAVAVAGRDIHAKVNMAGRRRIKFADLCVDSPPKEAEEAPMQGSSDQQRPELVVELPKMAKENLVEEEQASLPKESTLLPNRTVNPAMGGGKKRLKFSDLCQAAETNEVQESPAPSSTVSRKGSARFPDFTVAVTSSTSHGKGPAQEEAVPLKGAHVASGREGPARAETATTSIPAAAHESLEDNPPTFQGKGPAQEEAAPVKGVVVSAGRQGPTPAEAAAVPMSAWDKEDDHEREKETDLASEEDGPPLPARERGPTCGAPARLTSIGGLAAQAGRRPPEREGLRCAGPGCQFLAHSSPEFGGYCCLECFGNSGHGRRCQGHPAGSATLRKPDAWPLGRVLEVREADDMQQISAFLQQCTQLPDWLDAPVLGTHIHLIQRHTLNHEAAGQALLREQRISCHWNLALFCSATASSSESDYHCPDCAVDGSPCTRWSSAFEDGQSFQVDLGCVQPVAGVRVRWEAAYSGQYSLWGSSQGHAWTHLADEVGCEGWVSTAVSTLTGVAELRWLRLNCMQRATEYGISIREIAVVPIESLVPRAWSRLARALLERGTERQLRAGLLVCGSRGDWQPVIALALHMQRCGWLVRLFTCHPRHDPYVTLARSFHLEVEGWQHDSMAYEAIKLFFPDVLLHQWNVTHVCWVIEEQLGIPAVEYAFWPLPVRAAFDRFLEISLRKVGLELHLGCETLPALSEAHVFERLWQRRPLLYAFSSRVAQRQEHWPEAAATAGHHLTGSWELSAEQQEGELATASCFFGGKSGPRLQAFLASGPPPVYLGWGSMPGVSAPLDFTVELAARTLFVSGRRGIVLVPEHSAYDDLLRRTGDSYLVTYCRKHVLWLSGAPHEWLLPRCSIVVHHGGCSTTASSLRAGRPTVVTPVILDQFWWGSQVERLGVGVRTTDLQGLSPNDLAQALQQCDQPDIVSAAAALGEQLRSERGTHRAEEWLRQYVETHLSGYGEE